MARLATLLSWASSTQLESCLLCSTLAEAAAVQQDLAPRLKLTAPLGCLSFRHPAAGLQQHWQRSSAVRLQVQGMQRQVQPMQLSPIWSVVMVLASQPTGAAHLLSTRVDPGVLLHLLVQWYDACLDILMNQQQLAAAVPCAAF